MDVLELMRRRIRPQRLAWLMIIGLCLGGTVPLAWGFESGLHAVDPDDGIVRLGELVGRDASSDSGLPPPRILRTRSRLLLSRTEPMTTSTPHALRFTPAKTSMDPRSPDPRFASPGHLASGGMIASDDVYWSDERFVPPPRVMRRRRAPFRLPPPPQAPASARSFP